MAQGRWEVQLTTITHLSGCSRHVGITLHPHPQGLQACVTTHALLLGLEAK